MSTKNPETPTNKDPLDAAVDAAKNVKVPGENIPVATPITTQMTQEQLNQAVETRAQRKARIAKVVDRGFVQSRLTVNLPSDTYGEWVSDDPSEIVRFQSMGFRLASKAEFPNATLHGEGDDSVKVGDLKLMVAPMEVKEIIEEIRREEFQRRHGDPRLLQKGNVREEKEFKSQVGNSLPVIDESNTQFADAAAIRAALGQGG